MTWNTHILYILWFSLEQTYVLYNPAIRLGSVQLLLPGLVRRCWARDSLESRGAPCRIPCHGSGPRGAARGAADPGETSLRRSEAVPRRRGGRLWRSQIPAQSQRPVSILIQQQGPRSILAKPRPCPSIDCQGYQHEHLKVQGFYHPAVLHNEVALYAQNMCTGWRVHVSMHSTVTRQHACVKGQPSTRHRFEGRRLAERPLISLGFVRSLMIGGRVQACQIGCGVNTFP